MHPEILTVWWGLWVGGIIGPYFFKEAVNRIVTVNGELHREMIPLDYFLCGYIKALVYIDEIFLIAALENNIKGFIRPSCWKSMPKLR